MTSHDGDPGAARDEATGPLPATPEIAAHREMLLRNELQHRVRNMLAIIRSVFARTVASGGSLEDVADHFQGRLDAFTRFHAMLGTDPAARLDLDAMIRDELRAFAVDPRIALGGPDVVLSPDVAQLVGLALHELATNSIKFGVLSLAAGRGRLRISWSVADAGLVLVWDEDEVPVLSAAPVHHGFGREFIEQALPYQTGGAASFELRRGGMRCTISLPATGFQRE
jgi:two-component sensor histidine kinase